MKTFYHHDTRSFLNTATYMPEQIPDGSVEVSAELKKQLLEGERTGKVISVDSKGKPILVEPEADPRIPLNQERYWRDTEFERVKWLRERHRDELELQSTYTLTVEQYSELLAYMQLLRDWPQSDQFPEIEHRPVAPPWVDQQTK